MRDIEKCLEKNMISRNTWVGLMFGTILASVGIAATPLEEWDRTGEAPLVKPAREATVVDGLVWLDAEDFGDYGGWVADTQFVHLMGSAYLIAPVVGTPVADASTVVRIPEAGSFRVWVRTRDWLPEYHPGRFQVVVNDEPLAVTFGEARNDPWTWFDGGTVDLRAGANRIALHDVSGSFARCDALVLARDRGYVPPENVAEIERERARLTGLSLDVQPRGDFDVVVVGGGPAGCPAAIAAARLGAKTALIQDRPVLGGNASLELGVWLQGAAISLPNARETGIIEEASRIQQLEGHHSVSVPFQQLCDAERNLTVFLNTRAVGVRMADGKRIAAVKAIDTLTGAYSNFGARYVIDCTGDGWVGFYAGAEYRVGRESKSTYGEPDAPEVADTITMSGCIMGRHSLSYRSEQTGETVEYVAPAWAAAIPDLVALKRTPRSLATGEWWLEHAGTWDDLKDAERARDELIRISFGYWDYLKNRWPEREKLHDYALAYVPPLVAKRESRRLVGDHVLTTSEVLNGTIFPDRISYGGWPVDIHNPNGIYAGEGPYHTNYHIRDIYTIPFRCLYSANIDNLLFAGRCASFSHFALGTVRVERTLATLGQAAGTAAALCAAKNKTPRTLCQEDIGKLQQTLLKYDQYIPELCNEDPADLARTARVKASSTAAGQPLRRDDVKLADAWHHMDHRRAQMIHIGQARIDRAWLYLRSTRTDAVRLRLHVRKGTSPGDFSSVQDCAVAETDINVGAEGWIAFPLNVMIDTPCAWVWLEPEKDIEWRLMSTSLPGMQRAYATRTADGPDAWTPSSSLYACALEPPATAVLDCSPGNVVDGVARTVGDQTHKWQPNPEEAMPQWIELEFPETTAFNTVHVTFVTDLNARNQDLLARGVKSYSLEIEEKDSWRVLVSETNNIQRWRRHVFEDVMARRLRVVLHDSSPNAAGIYEVRVYRE